MDLLQQSGETLAGRIAYLELPPFVVLEVDPGDNSAHGYPQKHCGVFG